MKFKTRSDRHDRLAKDEPDGAAAWGNPCEVFGCRNDAVMFYHGRELCNDCRLDLVAENEADHALLDQKREVAMEEGRLHGIDAYNDVMGWGSSEPYEEEP